MHLKNLGEKWSENEQEHPALIENAFIETT